MVASDRFIKALLCLVILLIVRRPDAQADESFKVEHSVVIPIESKILGRRYEAYVKIPPSYDSPENQHRHYPVLYMTDGAYTFQVASGVTMVPFNHNRLKEFILVGISNAVNEDPGIARSRDLTPWSVQKYTHQTGGAANYLEFIKTELVPIVENRFRIDPGQRVLTGQSYGGLFGLWVAFKDPDLFQSYILTSPSIWYARRSILTSEADYLRTHRDLKAKIYLTAGQMEVPGECGSCTVNMIADAKNLAERLRSRRYPGLEVRYEESRGTDHETTFPVGLLKGLQWLFPGAGE